MSNAKSQYGIIGKPLTHSLSPVMHNAAFKALGVNAEYKKFPLEENELDDFFAALRQRSSPVFGLNVTVPYKEEVMQYLDSVVALAQKIGAVNTIVINKDRKLVGYNTDAPGFLAHLAELKVDIKDRRIGLLGAGGSARALLTAFCLLPEKPAAILVYNRTASRLEELMASLAKGLDISLIRSVLSVEEMDVRRCDILINTTSVGLREDDPVLIDESMLHPDLFVYDLIYNPAETLFLRMAREAGARTSNGLGMLYYQGVLALQHWADVQLDEKVKLVMREALEEAVGL
jgi:shikimate dehydrogenase